MSEFIVTMSSNSGWGQTEYQSKRVLVGEMEAVLQRLIVALERIGYVVVSEQPLVAKNTAQQNALSGVNCFPSVLNSPIRLTVGLRKFNDTSTLATFDYTITNSVVTKGDQQTLEREIEALVALTTARPVAALCTACGTALTSDSRFCRACGAPSSTDEPAEVEVLRLTAGARAAHQNIVGSVITILSVLALALPLIFFARKGPKPGIVLLIIGELSAFAWLLYGMYRLHSTLNSKRGERRLTPAPVPRAFAEPPALDTSALPQLPARHSVTEGTTELLSQPATPREAVPVNRQSRDTGPIN